MKKEQDLVAQWLDDELASQWSWVRFLLFTSPEPKVQLTFYDHNLSVVRRRHCSRRKLFTFSSPEQLGEFHSNLALELRGLKFVQMKDLAFIQGEIITKKWICIDKFLKSYSPEPHGQFQPTFAKSGLGWSRLKFIQMKNLALFQW